MTRSQDVAFSQFYQNNIYLNPALVGSVDQDFQFTSNYRNQWRSLSEAFKSVSLAYEMALYQDYFSKEYLGIGFAYFNDKAGVSLLKLNLFSLALSYSLQSDRYNSIAGGIIGNYGRRSIDFSQVQWENQHNGNNFDASLPSGEIGLSDRFNYWDVGAGFTWKYKDVNQGIGMELGLASYHINQPDQSFIKDKSDRLKRKWLLNGSFDMAYATFDIIPKLLLSSQGNNYSAMVGGINKIEV